MRFDEYASYDGLGLAELIEKGEVTPLELVEACIERIEKHNPKINAVVLRMDDMARQACAGVLPDGPFRGVPYMLKDILAQHAGVSTSAACRAIKNLNVISPIDSELVARYKRAGLICVGKTNCSELGLTNTTGPLLFGPTRNPWDTSRIPGGSSGGSGAAVACGMVPFAHGNDIGGSIRIPSSCCGLVGLKPTRARNPLGPIYGDLASGTVQEHVLSRTVRDSAAVLDATAGPDLGDPYWAPPPVGRFLDAARRYPGRLRIAFSTTDVKGGPLHEDCVNAVENAARLCESLGHVVEPARPAFDLDIYRVCFGTLFLACISSVVNFFETSTGIKAREDGFEPLTLAAAEMAKGISAGAYLNAVTGLQSIAREIARFFKTYDVWLTSTVGSPPPLIGHVNVSSSDFMSEVQKMEAFSPICPLANATGQPSISLPLHWNVDDLPIGVLFTGRFGDEETLLSLAAQLEQAAPWRDKHPPIGG
ncbi:MAG: amidase [Deltaproteobacteria bacterium]|nr:amidase [Deltaproteobacteria bacterium]